MTQVHALAASVVPISVSGVTEEVATSWLAPARGVRRKSMKNMISQRCSFGVDQVREVKVWRRETKRHQPAIL